MSTIHTIFKSVVVASVISVSAAGIAYVPPVFAEAAVIPPVVGEWRFDQLITQSGSKITPSAINPADNGMLDATTSVRRVFAPAATTGTSSFYFRGWDDGNLADAMVHPTESSVRIPDKPNFNPENKFFKVSVNIKPRNPAGVTGILKSDTLNIVQKGRSDIKPGKQWKISMTYGLQPMCDIVGSGSPAGTSNAIHITPTTRDERVAAKMKAFDAPLRPPNKAVRAGYTISCELRKGQARLQLNEISVNSTTGETQDMLKYDSGFVGPVINTDPSGATAGPNPNFTVTNTDKVWVGKKPNNPNTTNPGDTFAGVIDNLKISKDIN